MAQCRPAPVRTTSTVQVTRAQSVMPNAARILSSSRGSMSSPDAGARSSELGRLELTVYPEGEVKKIRSLRYASSSAGTLALSPAWCAWAVSPGP